MDENCVFCQIIARKIPVSVAYEDDLVIGIMDTQPVNPGHALIIPKKHSPSMRDMDEAAGMHLFKVTLRMEQAIRKSGVRCEGIRLHLADGEAAGQDVFHVHMHVVPRFMGDGFKVTNDWSTRPSREELDRVADQIRDAYKALWVHSA